MQDSRPLTWSDAHDREPLGIHPRARPALPRAPLGRPVAPKVFLLHGFLDVSATWQPVAAGLLPKFQVLCPDFRGFGATEWPQDGYWFPDYLGDLEVVVDHYSPGEPILLVGHSMGAQIASLYAGLRPDRVGKLACLDGLFLPDTDPSVTVKRFRGWLDELKDLPKEKAYASFDELASRIAKWHPELDAAGAAFVARCWGREDGHGRVTLCADPKHRLRGPGLYRAEESMAVWREITAPTLFLDAGKSQFGKAITPEETKRRRECFRSYRAEVIADGTHMLHFSAPAATARAILAFLS
jgi:pimeloyl-ACP methyl ester carboxylesterase